MLAAKPNCHLPPSDRVDFLLRANHWNEKKLGAELKHNGLPAVEQWQISRWKLRKEIPPKARVSQIEDLCYDTILRTFESQKGFHYICNISDSYGDNFTVRESDALARLKEALIRNCPWPPVGMLQIVVLPAALPEGVRAQCFHSDHVPPRYFFVLVRDDLEWQENIKNVRDEVFAHVLSPALDSGDLPIKDN
jgi:hypothetical protein